MKCDLAKLLPHKEPFILVDELLSVDETTAVSRVNISDESAFADNGLVPNFVGIEYIAQTIGLFSGYHLHDHSEAAIGFLLSVRDCEFFCVHFHTGQELLIEVKVDLIGSGLATFVGTIRHQNQILVSAKVTTIRPEPQELAAIKEEAWKRANVY